MALELARAELTASIEQLRTESYLKTIRAGVTFNQADRLGELAVPVQLIFGSDDALTPPSIGTEMASLLPDAELAVIDGAGHLSNIEKPTEFNAALSPFLLQHRDRASTPANL